MHYNYYDIPDPPAPVSPPPAKAPTPEAPPKKRGGAGRVIAFCLCLLLILNGIAALFVLELRLRLPEAPGLLDYLPDYLPGGAGQPDPPGQSDLPAGPAWDGGEDGGDGNGSGDYGFGYNYSSGTTAPPTTVERYPSGGTLTLELAGIPRTGALSYQKIYTKVLPSIVGIRAHLVGGGATGTGIVLTADGYIITNFHIIEGADRVEVLLQDETLHKALLVGGDRANDLAVLKIDVSGLTPAEFGDSDLLQVGDATLAIGNPLGEELKNTMTDGIVSAINRDVRHDGITMTLIQTTAALNPGNSGGALINIYGQVVGITNMKMMSSYETIEGLGFAIPSATVQSVAAQLVAHGKLVGRPTLGITVQEMPESTWSQYSLPDGFEGGILVVAVVEKSDAWKSGVRVGDVIVEADRRPIRAIDDLLTLKNSKAVGDHLRIKLWRDGRYLTINVTLIDQYELDNVGS